MNITHVIRGDDHVNNTPRQINIFRALGASLPKFVHVPMILGPDGERLSKRHGAVSVMQYEEDGYLPEAVLNYLARLGWSHRNEEVFPVQQFVDWFDLEHISHSAAQFNPEKLLWLNAQYLKGAGNDRLASLVGRYLIARGCDPAHGPALDQVAGLLKERVNTLEDLADAAVYFYKPLHPTPELRQQHYSEASLSAVEAFVSILPSEWSRENISAALKSAAEKNGLKLGKVAMPLRVMVTGETQTPSIDATLELIGREEVARRIEAELAVARG
jgi:glutamyl-tRNA synthetase